MLFGTLPSMKGELVLSKAKIVVCVCVGGGDNIV